MKTEMEIKQALRNWIIRKNGKIRGEELLDDTLIIEQRIITSMEVLDLILFIESLGASGFDISKLEPNSFKSIQAIYAAFFSKGAET
jgi:acyl carrier protein